MSPAARGPKRRRGARPAGGPAGDTVPVWEDDPLSARGLRPVRRPRPRPETLRLGFDVVEPRPRAGAHRPGSAGLRWWTAVEALDRGIRLFAPEIPARAWAGGERLRVHVDRGRGLNAFYDRHTLSFFHDRVAGRSVHTAASPDVVCHELGHALLDVVRPALWNVMAAEVAAFHESFGDLAALLCALELPSLRDAVLEETGGALYRSSRVSRLAELLGWAIRQRRPELVADDCLRNAVNAFAYRPASALPATGPHAELSSEPHSLSRVFTGAAFEALAGIWADRGGRADDAGLLRSARRFRPLLVEAVRTARITPGWFCELAAALIEADRRLYRGRHAEPLRTAFVRRGLLTVEAAARVGAARPRPRVAADERDEMPQVRLPGAPFGCGRRTLAVAVAGSAPRRGIAAAGATGARVVAPSARRAAREFVATLVLRGRVDFGGHAVASAAPAQPRVRKTHVVVERAGQLVLERRRFDCGFDA